jgi:hypothetical protein
VNSLRHIPLDDVSRRIAQATFSFFLNRLSEAQTVEWAARLNDEDLGQRVGILDLLDRNEAKSIAEPWRTAWRTIEESWNSPTPPQDAGMSAHAIKSRLRRGDLSGALIDELVELVRPKLKVSPFSTLHRQMQSRRGRIKSMRDLFSVQIKSGRGLDPQNLGLNAVTDEAFLIALATALESAVLKGLDIARRVGWQGASRLWMAGQLHRVYFVPAEEIAANRDEPDHFHEGIAPSVKLLFATVARLSALGSVAASQFVRRWRLWDSPIHVRLWAAAARDARLASTSEVAEFLLNLDAGAEWDVLNFPEVAELQARRFGELSGEAQKRILVRLRKGPPRRFWRRRLTPEQLIQARTAVIVRELARIEAGGAQLPAKDRAWLDANSPDGIRDQGLTAGFLGSPIADWVGNEPDPRFDMLAGAERLSALERALAAPRTGWNEDPASAATAWIRQGANLHQVLSDLEATRAANAPYPKVWDQFGWIHTPREPAAGEAEAPPPTTRVLALLGEVAQPVLRDAIEGLANWFFNWSSQLAFDANTLAVWLRLWPLAVDAANTRAPEPSRAVSDVAQVDTNDEAVAIDTLNSAVGKLMQVFLQACPDLTRVAQPFTQEPLRTMRQHIIDAGGRAGLIARYRLTEEVGYFLNADPEWAARDLLAPLRADSEDALQLWKALGRRFQSHEVLNVIGLELTERAVDMRLARDTREVLASNLIIEGLYAYKLYRAPAVPFQRIQQTVRSVEDEVRAHCADTLRKFAANRPAGESGEQLLLDAVIPFLSNVWPQERSLSTPGVSRALALLPATAPAAFAGAVRAVERFLVPFDCWSMHDYGLHANDEDDARLLAIDSPAKAAALLTLLDKTIASTEGAVIPYDIGVALERIRQIDQQLASTRAFRRLATASRRG